MLKFVSLIILLLLLPAVLSGCASQPLGSDYRPLKVGVTAGPHAEIMAVVAQEAAKQGLKIQVIEFTDYTQPNIALHQGSIDANIFQHQPYLDSMVRDSKYDITSVAKTIVLPMGLYSKKIKSTADLKSKALVVIPDDLVNSGRALLLLEKTGLIKLKPGTGLQASTADIGENPRAVLIKELDAAQIVPALESADLVAVNSNRAVAAGLVPSRDALILEDASSPYANVIAVRTKDRDTPAVIKLIRAYQSDEVKQFIQEHFAGSVAAAW